MNHMKKYEDKVYIAGHKGMVGSAIFRKLSNYGYKNIITTDRSALDLTNQIDVRNFLNSEKPDKVYIAAAKVGGIYANNTYPADFIYQNLQIQTNLIHESYKAGVKKLLFLGSSCIYPKLSRQPISEESLLSGYLEPTNEPYAIAKIAGVKMCESYSRQYSVDYRSVMPTNLYGPGDNYHPDNSHVIPALIRKFHEAKVEGKKSVVIWGSGKAKREFLYVDDLADACVSVMELDINIYKSLTNSQQSFLNVGYGTDISIFELCEVLKDIIEFQGEIIFDLQMPDGPLQKLMDSSKIQSIGWKPSKSLKGGLNLAYENFLELYENKNDR